MCDFDAYREVRGAGANSLTGCERSEGMPRALKLTSHSSQDENRRQAGTGCLVRKASHNFSNPLPAEHSPPSSNKERGSVKNTGATPPCSSNGNATGGTGTNGERRANGENVAGAGRTQPVNPPSSPGGLAPASYHQRLPSQRHSKKKQEDELK